MSPKRARDPAEASAERAALLRASAVTEIIATIERAESTVADVNLALEEARRGLSRTSHPPAETANDQLQHERLRGAHAKLDTLEDDLRDLERRLEEETSFAAEWHRRAEAAVIDGRDDLARDALAREKGHAALIRSLTHDHATASSVLDELRNLLGLIDDQSNVVRPSRTGKKPIT